ncbi:MAG: helix-turn-helix domain-containing protein [Nocardioides sp.]
MVKERVEEITVRRNLWLTAGIAAASAALAIAFAVRHGSWLDWACAVVLAAIAVGWGRIALDARRPLMVLDARGARVRSGSEWAGLPWTDLVEIEHLPSGRLRDGHLRLVGLDGSVHSVQLTLATRLHGAEEDLVEQIADLARGRTTVVLVDPDLYDDEIDAGGTAWFGGQGPEGTVEIPRGTGRPPGEPTGSLGGFATPEMVRERSRFGASSRPTSDARAVTMRFSMAAIDGANALQISVITDSDQLHDPVVLPEHEELVRPEVPFDFETEEGPDPVIGPFVVAARQRAGLSVEQLAARTGLRADVIEAIEVDDFAPCGGDFYARGHIRTLARVLGLDGDALAREYDELYADTLVDPIPAMRAEMANASGGGPNWSILVAAVMAIVLAWSIVRLVVDSSAPNLPAAPSLSAGSGGEVNPYAGSLVPVPVVITAAGGGARVVVRDGEGKVAFAGSLAFGQSETMQLSLPVRVQTSDGSLTVSVDGADPIATGDTGQATQRLFTGTP